MTARLVLLTGSQSGIVAPLQQGYYMIGRHQECQIRPKSRSVSRRHCVLHFQGDRLSAMDLASTSGSKRNADRFTPKTWVVLEDGDTLKLGKVQFRVCFESAIGSSVVPDEEVETGIRSPTATASDPPSSGRMSDDLQPAATNGAVQPNGAATKQAVPAAPRQHPSERKTDRPSMVSGAAWDTFDVATFLHDEDNFDREERYDQIRSKNIAAKEAAERERMDDEESSSDSVIDPFDDSALDETLHEDDDGDSGKRQTRPAARRPTPLPPRKREFSMPGWWRPRGNVDYWKLIAAVVMTIAILGFSGWKIFQFIQGPEVRVMQELN